MSSSAEPLGGFVSTQWSIVVAAQSRHAPDGAAAMATLCNRYWRPLYGYVRRRGYSPEDAQDLTQTYFLRLLEKNFLDQVDAQRGKFRSFLLASFKHFLANEWDKGNAAKRGGGVEFLGIEDVLGVEHHYAGNLLDTALNPEQLYERSWAMTILDRATARLASEFAAAGKSGIFEGLKVFLTGDQPGVKYAEVAASVGMSEGAARVAVHRLRDRFRALLRTEIAQTLANPADPRTIDEELRHLLTAL
jgi:RNA polymerase sigma-70 factor (ECF subfamily)